jgi:hypothetical protein
VTSSAVAIWEYLIVPELERHQLSGLGEEGWELVGLGGSSDERMLYLKRPGQDFRERVTIEQRTRYYQSRGRDLRSDLERGPA